MDSRRAPLNPVQFRYHITLLYYNTSAKLGQLEEYRLSNQSVMDDRFARLVLYHPEQRRHRVPVARGGADAERLFDRRVRQFRLAVIDRAMQVDLALCDEIF